MHYDRLGVNDRFMDENKHVYLYLFMSPLSEKEKYIPSNSYNLPFSIEMHKK